MAACKPIERTDQPFKRAISKKRKRKEKKRKLPACWRQCATIIFGFGTQLIDILGP
jgi:hypothetical protein